MEQTEKNIASAGNIHAENPTTEIPKIDQCSIKISEISRSESFSIKEEMRENIFLSTEHCIIKEELNIKEEPEEELLAKRIEEKQSDYLWNNNSSIKEEFDATEPVNIKCGSSALNASSLQKNNINELMLRGTKCEDRSSINEANNVISNCNWNGYDSDVDCNPDFDFENNFSCSDVVEQGRKRSRQRHHCYFCGSLVMNFAKHIQRHHSQEPEVKKIISARTNSKERKNLIQLLRKRGDFLVSEECVKPMKKSKILNAADYLPCTHCLGFYSRKHLWKHQKTCSENKNQETFSLSLAQNLLVKSADIDSDLQKKVFPHMRADLLSLTAKKDDLICALGAKYLRTRKKEHLINVTSRKMREIARILIELQNLEPGIENLRQALEPRRFGTIIDAVKRVARYDATKNIFLSPTYAVNIACSLRQCCEIAAGDFANSGAESKFKSMIQLFRSHWPIHQTANGFIHNTKVTIVSLAADLKTLWDYLKLISEKSAAALNSTNCGPEAYMVLLEAVYCQIFLLNWRKSVDVEKIQLSSYGTPEENCEEFSELPIAERILLAKSARIVLEKNNGRAVPILFSTGANHYFETLLKFRPRFADKSNPYLFPELGQKSAAISGNITLKKYVQKCRTNPETITSGKFRRQLSTLSQLLTMDKPDLEQLLSYLTNTIGVHKSFQLPDDFYQTAKLSKLLHLIDDRTAEQCINKPIDTLDLDLAADLESESGREEEGFFLNSSTVPKFNEKSLASEPKRRAKSINIKRRNLVQWTSEQAKVVESFFSKHIQSKTPARKAECLQVISENPGLLANKNWQKIKVFVQNKYTQKYKT